MRELKVLLPETIDFAELLYFLGKYTKETIDSHTQAVATQTAQSGNAARKRTEAILRQAAFTARRNAEIFKQNNRARAMAQRRR